MSKRAKYEQLLNNKNVVATLHTIAAVESKIGPESYGMIVGGTFITPSSNHPAILVPSSNSDAAGRYQFLSTTWARINSEIGPLDFSNPRHQDIAAIWLIELRGVLQEVINGDITAAMTGAHDASLKQYPDRVCERNKSGLGCEWAGVYPNRYDQAAHPLQGFLDDFEKYKNLPLDGLAPPTDDTTDLSAFSSGSNPGTGNQTAMQSFAGSMQYGASSIVGFLGNTSRKILSHNSRSNKVEPGHALTSVKKVMGGEGNLTGFTPGMNTAPPSEGALKAGEFTPKPGAYINPLPGATFTSAFRWRWGRMHNGVDLSTGRMDAPVLASGDGEVIDVETNCQIVPMEECNGCGGGYGNLVHLKHSDGLVSTYNHLRAGSVKVSIGQKVKQGDIIGIEGHTGCSTGEHLHFEFWTGAYGTKAIDPETIVPELSSLSRSPRADG